MDYTSLIFLIISCTTINGLHAYLLISQRKERKLTISDHAISTRNTQRVFILGHFFGITCYALFAYYFYSKHGHKGLFYLALCVWVLDIIQAVLPASGKTEKKHLLSAYGMGLLSLITTTMATLILNQCPQVRILSLILLGIIYIILAKTVFIRKKIYLDQMIMIILLDTVLVLTLIATEYH